MKYVYTPLFGKNRISYLKEQGKYIIIAIIDVSVTYVFVSMIKVENCFVQCIINGCIALIVPNIINYLLLRKTEEFVYYKNFYNNILKIKLKEKFAKNSNVKIDGNIKG